MDLPDQNPQPIKQSRLPRIRITRKFVAFIFLLTLILAGCFAYAYYKDSKKEPVVVRDQCSNEKNSKMLQSIYTKLQAPDKQKLVSDVEVIKKIPNYQQDATCLYPIIIYEIAIGNSSAAQATLISLEASYKPEVGYSPYYGTDTLNPKTLRPQVETLVKQRELNQTQFNNLSPKVR